jgi:excisionase family DNA binding protein
MAAIRSEGLSSSGGEGDALRGHKKALGPDGRRQRLVPVEAAAEYLGVSRATVERLVSRDQLPVVKVGASTRYDVEDLDRFIESNRFRDRRRSA